MTSWSDQIYRLITIEECKAHRRLFLNSLLLFILVSFFCEPAVGQDSPLLIAVEDDADPWSLKDGTGYANDVVTAAFKAVTIDVQLRVMPYARCKRMAVNGEVVACFSTSPSPELDGVIELFLCQKDFAETVMNRWSRILFQLGAQREFGQTQFILIDLRWGRSACGYVRRIIKFGNPRFQRSLVAIG